MRTTIGVDNGSTGSIGMLTGNGFVAFDPMPTKDYNYGKAGKFFKRVDVDELTKWIASRLDDKVTTDVRAYVERPFTGSSIMVNTMVLSARAHEAVLIALEQLGIGVETVDSRQWQANVLPKVSGSIALKMASSIRGTALYPKFSSAIKSHGDADGLLIAHYYHNLK